MHPITIALLILLAVQLAGVAWKHEANYAALAIVATLLILSLVGRI